MEDLKALVVTEVKKLLGMVPGQPSTIVEEVSEVLNEETNRYDIAHFSTVLIYYLATSVELLSSTRDPSKDDSMKPYKDWHRLAEKLHPMWGETWVTTQVTTWWTYARQVAFMMKTGKDYQSVKVGWAIQTGANSESRKPSKYARTPDPGPQDSKQQAPTEERKHLPEAVAEITAQMQNLSGTAPRQQTN